MVAGGSCATAATAPRRQRLGVGYRRLTGYREGAVVRRLTQWHARPGVDREEAVRYWTQEHARLVERVPSLQRYVQHVAVVDPDGSEPPYAGLGEAAFASVEDAARATESDEWAAVIADARTFMDFERLVVGWAASRVVVPAAGRSSQD